MGKTRGKTLTRAQRQLLSKEGVKDLNNWLYVKTETISADGSKCAARNSTKHIRDVFVHKETNEIKYVNH